ncbi:MAG: hypothetical protein H6R21_2710 [Proteobacteria bacterium]|nr:hypothetical protein [Pseudomonadota bacterium]
MPWQRLLAAAVTLPAVVAAPAGRWRHFAGGSARDQPPHPLLRRCAHRRRRLHPQPHRAPHHAHPHPGWYRLPLLAAWPLAAAEAVSRGRNQFAGPPTSSRLPRHSFAVPVTGPWRGKRTVVRPPRRPGSKSKQAGKGFVGSFFPSLQFVKVKCRRSCCRFTVLPFKLRVNLNPLLFSILARRILPTLDMDQQAGGFPRLQLFASASQNRDAAPAFRLTIAKVNNSHLEPRHGRYPAACCAGLQFLNRL